MNIKIVAIEEIEKGRVLLTKIEYGGVVFVIVNIYAPNMWQKE